MSTVKQKSTCSYITAQTPTAGPGCIDGSHIFSPDTSHTICCCMVSDTTGSTTSTKAAGRDGVVHCSPEANLPTQKLAPATIHSLFTRSVSLHIWTLGTQIHFWTISVSQAADTGWCENVRTGKLIKLAAVWMHECRFFCIKYMILQCLTIWWWDVRQSVHLEGWQRRWQAQKYDTHTLILSIWNPAKKRQSFAHAQKISLYLYQLHNLYGN